MKNLIIKIFIFLMILGVIYFFSSYYVGKKLEKFQSLISSNTSTLNFSPMQTSSSSINELGEVQNKKFVSPDGKIEFEYTSDWITLPNKFFKEENIPNELKEKYNLDILLFAQKIKKEKSTQLVLMEGDYNSEDEIEKDINLMGKNNQNNGWKMEIINFDKNNGFTYEAKYEKENSLGFHSKEKIILLPPEKEEKKAYFIVLLSFEKDWLDFQEEIDEIINSVQIVK